MGSFGLGRPRFGVGIKRLTVEGGPHVSGSYVNAGLVDEISVLILPLVDGCGAHLASFSSPLRSFGPIENHSYLFDDWHG
ncbi:dihydrofolate reductase family protein [Pseudomonas reactans]|jgi:riboflavin biosynthesis pyrimidine reductase|uniref:dihydrofolate reductase family protein n=1 Tax=Pseudomonas TaxID=286 RepID=UPI00210AE5DB|nr:MULTISPECIES: dihydrofolate reductase family protein [Pseudomonas]